MEKNTGEERLCIQLNNIRLSKFFMGLGGVDQGGKCSSEFLNMMLVGSEPYSVVTAD